MKSLPRAMLLAAALLTGTTVVAAPAAHAYPYRGHGGYGFRGGYGYGRFGYGGYGRFGFHPSYYGFGGRYAGYGYPGYGFRGYAPFWLGRPVIYAYPRAYVIRPSVVVVP